jgi:hypothetical protein
MDANPALTKAAVRINGGQAIALKRHGAGDVIGNANIVLSKVAEAYGGIGGGFQTVRIELPVTGLVAGQNTITFENVNSSPISLGFRIVSFDIVDGPASATQRPSLLVDGSLREDDPALWKTSATAADIQAGAALWTKRSSLYDPLHDSLDGVTDGGAMNGKITAACADCHARNGYDLKYFNYSGKAIIARSAFHRLAPADGTKIAAYIRSLNIPYAANARPWNPPYQPISKKYRSLDGRRRNLFHADV